MSQGLRNRIVQKITLYRKLQRRRRVGRYALVAAILAMLGITGHGLYRAAQPTLNLEVLARDLDRMVERPDQALSEWLSEQRLPPELPLPFDFRQYVFHGYQRIAGRNVPVIVFQRWRGSATTPEVLKLYIVKSSDFHLDSLLATSGSFYTARVITHEAEDPGIIYLALSTTAELTPFLLQPLTPAAS
jgi:hypothetical protein